MIKYLALLFLLFLQPTVVFAGYNELGFSANYRNSTIDDNNYQKSLSFTGSFSYYFWEMSAIEFSYTNGASELSAKPPNDIRIITRTSFELYGADFVITFAGRQSAFQPYIKIGAAKITKKIVREPENNDAVETGRVEGTVPSAGLGVRLRINKEFLIKLGVDAWTSPLDKEPITVDYAAKAGISWVF